LGFTPYNIIIFRLLFIFVVVVIVSYLYPGLFLYLKNLKNIDKLGLIVEYLFGLVFFFIVFVLLFYPLLELSVIFFPDTMILYCMDGKIEARLSRAEYMQRVRAGRV
jgi:hypothetical protein